MTSDQSDPAVTVLGSAPCSVQMPAGCGKTHLLASVVKLAATRGMAALILTHTHAGVDAMAHRLRDFGVSQNSAHIDTIDGWAIRLAAAYATISGARPTFPPDWSQKGAYLDGAGKVALSPVGRKILSARFDLVLVDEYQDCSLSQHRFILAMREAVHRTIAFGDPLQGIFGFDEALPPWKEVIEEDFPPLEVPYQPYRWATTNPDFGDFSLAIRPQLSIGSTLDFASTSVPGIRYIQGQGIEALRQAIQPLHGRGESIVLLDKWPQDVARHSAITRGYFSVMEDIAGRFMATELATLPPEGDPQMTEWLWAFSRKTMVGLPALHADDLASPYAMELAERRLATSPAKCEVAEATRCLRILRDVYERPDYLTLAAKAGELSAMESVRVYRREALKDTIITIRRLADMDDANPGEALAKVRERIRRIGRSRTARATASRTLLVKGLEFDHVIIANLQNFTDAANLYVALTRARRSVTILGSSSRVCLTQ